MKDFDHDRKARVESDRSFQMRGETFTVKAGVRPEVFAPYVEKAGELPLNALLPVIDELVLELLEDADGAKRWGAVRAAEEDPVTIVDLNLLVEWLMEQQTGRPTSQPSGSSPGRKQTGMTSTAASSSPDSPGELVRLPAVNS